MPVLSLVPGSSLVAQMVKNLPAMRETWVPSLEQEDPLEMGMATHSSILAWRIPGLYSPRGHKETDTTERLSLHLPFATTWMDLESTVLNEISHGSSLVV